MKTAKTISCISILNQLSFFILASCSLCLFYRYGEEEHLLKENQLFMVQ